MSRKRTILVERFRVFRRSASVIRHVGRILILVLALPTVAKAQDSKKQPATPAEQYQTLVKEAEKARLVYFLAIKNASDEDRAKLSKVKALDFAPQFLALAEKYAKDPAALDALVWVVTQQFLSSEDKDVILAKALEILIRDHMNSQKLSEICQTLGDQMNQVDPTAFFVAVMEKSPHKEVKAEACLALAFRPLERARIADELKKNPARVKDFADEFGKAFTIAVQKEDVAKLLAESAKHFGHFVEYYSGLMSPNRLSDLTLTLSYHTDKVSESVLRSLLGKDARAEVRGPATLYLAVLLRERADLLADQDAEEATKLRTESEGLLERAVEKYADVPLSTVGGVGKQAKKELFTLRNLTIGKVAPDIEGEDQFGKRFNLRDYRGKVVLLDFWSQH
jgi:hypothetical protein